MGTVYITQPDAFLGKQDERLQVRANRQTLLDIPLLKVDGLIVLGRATLSPALLMELLERKIGLTFLTTTGKYLGQLAPPLTKNVFLRRSQWRATESQALALSQSFVRGKLKNYRYLLRRGATELVHGNIEQLERAIANLAQAETIDRVRGLEGAASATYFAALDHLLKIPEFKFAGRSRRPPLDPVNALLSFGYVLLQQEIGSALNVAGFDPYCGFLHTEQYGRPSLALDLMEEFRPLVVDATVLAVLNRRSLSPADFETEPISGAVSLKKEGLQTFLRLYEQKKQSQFKHPVLKRKCSYREAFEIQARLLAKYLLGEIDQYPPLVMR